MFTDRWRNRLGFMFFTAATVLYLVGAGIRPSLLAGLMALYNLIRMGLYLKRRPARAYDRRSLWLGLIALCLPAVRLPAQLPTAALVVGLSGYGLAVASLLTLNLRYGIGAADRGLVTRGPYRLLRHPQYLGELMLGGALLVSLESWDGGLRLLILTGIQVLRVLLEEKVLADYAAYARTVKWRLIPLLW